MKTNAMSLREKLCALSNSNSYTDKLRAAAIEKEAEGDTELSETMRLLAAQLEFAPDGDENEAVMATREKLAGMIDERMNREDMRYHHIMSDDEVLAASNGEVTCRESVNYAACQWTSKGLYDPSIFGGSGVIPAINEEGERIRKGKEPPFGNTLGHIVLPVRVLPDLFVDEVAALTGLPEDFIQKLAQLMVWIKFDEEGKWDMSEAMDVKELAEKHPNVIPENVISGGEAIYRLLVGLHLPDHPENIAFQILQVAPTGMRPTFVVEPSFKVTVNELNQAYESVLGRASRLKRLMELSAPSVIIANESRMLAEVVDRIYAILTKAKEGDILSKYASSVQLALSLRVRVIGYTKPEKGFIPGPMPYDAFPENATVRAGDTERSVPLMDVLNKMSKLEDELEDAQVTKQHTKEEAEALDQQIECVLDEMRQVQQTAASGKPVILSQDSEGNYHPIKS